MSGQLDAGWQVILQGLYYLMGLRVFASLLSIIKEAPVQGSAHGKPRANSGFHLFSGVKCYWNAASLVCLSISLGRSEAVQAE